MGGMRWRLSGGDWGEELVEGGAPAVAKVSNKDDESWKSVMEVVMSVGKWEQ